MPLHNVEIKVMDINGYCPVYKKGDVMVLEGFRIRSKKSADICIHALTGMMSLLSAFSHGLSAKDLGIGSSDDLGYVKCPDPGPPLTEGGSVLFELRRFEEVKQESEALHGDSTVKS